MGNLIQLLSKKSTYAILRIAGIGLLIVWVAYFSENNIAFSILGVLSYVVLAFTVAYVLILSKLGERFPILNQYYFYPLSERHEQPLKSDNDLAINQSEYLENGLRGPQMLFSVAEDGLICVPVLLAGISPLSALVGGVSFATIHIGRFSYLECLGKGIIYGFVCFYILPHGLLTVIVGHFCANVLTLVSLRLVRRKFKT